MNTHRDELDAEVERLRYLREYKTMAKYGLSSAEMPPPGVSALRPAPEVVAVKPAPGATSSLFHAPRIAALAPPAPAASAAPAPRRRASPVVAAGLTDPDRIRAYYYAQAEAEMAERQKIARQRSIR